MTISTQTASVTVDGDSSNTTFTFNFEIPTQPDGVTPAVSVFTTHAFTNTPRVLGVDYSIAGTNSPTGGTITYPLTGSPLPVGDTITIQRAAVYEQPFAFPNQDFQPSQAEAAMDWIVMTLQQVVARLGTIPNFVFLSQADYDALTSPDPNTVYLITS